jgi:hypothetical protein
MAHERKRALAEELDERYSKDKGNLSQQIFRSAYYNLRLSGRLHTEALERAVSVVSRDDRRFTPVERGPIHR